MDWTWLARGADQTAFVVLEQPHGTNDLLVKYIECINTPDLKTVIGKTLYLDKFFNFKKIIVDTTGIGAGVTDILKGELGQKVEAVWYSQKKKVEMFNNMKILMAKPKEKGKLYIPNYLKTDDPNVKKMYYQFLSITEEYKNSDATKLPKISHTSRSHDDIINAIALACSYFGVGKKQNKGYTILGYNFT